ncbi:MAG: hypothetical protein JW798_15070 [Prolixibacteraceae bacterium]|nr:hypothetical protein [Prolixibacteraceae bacterium]
MKYTILIILLFIGQLLYAQPVPPSEPSEGNPVPIGGISLLLLVMGGLYLFFWFRKSKKQGS